MSRTPIGDGGTEKSKGGVVTGALCSPMAPTRGCRASHKADEGRLPPGSHQEPQLRGTEALGPPGPAIGVQRAEQNWEDRPLPQQAGMCWAVRKRP